MLLAGLPLCPLWFPQAGLVDTGNSLSYHQSLITSLVACALLTAALAQTRIGHMVHSQRVYVESTVWYQLANYTASDFKKRAQQLLSLIAGSEFAVHISTVVLEELAYNSRKYRDRVEGLLREHRPVVVSFASEAEDLAHAYVENAFPKRDIRDVIVDTFHAAIATTGNTAYVASYNYRNLLNVQTMARINAVNLLAGLNRQIAILPPFMFLELDDYYGEKGTVDTAVWKIKSEYGGDLVKLMAKKEEKRREHFDNIAEQAEKKLGLSVVRLGELEM